MVLVNAGKAARIKVRGVVQGVGFRPFVYRLAHEHNLKGWVRNTSGNVEIAAEGAEASVKDFIADLKAKAPPLARIEHIESSSCSPKGYTSFDIHDSLSRKGKYQLVSPDIASCEDCQREIFDPQDRRHRYPFTNCTNCGPRFTIIQDIPYDRPLTTMSKFQMCPQCQREYDDPLDRRFHTQPNACPVCGPRLTLTDSGGRVIETDDPIKSACELLKEGGILALRGLGGFQLACDAADDGAVKRLRERKRRPSKPFAVMMATMEDIESHCEVSPQERGLLSSAECPIVLLNWRRQSSSISEAVGPGLNYLGAMLPYTPLHHLLLRETGRPLVMTSGNLSEEPIAKDNDEALRRLGQIADHFLLHDRDISARYDDSVAIVEGAPQLIRRARGYAPYPIHLPFNASQILACGAELKNTFCLTKDNHAFISQHIGDMENEETLEHFEDTVELYTKLFRVTPQAIAHDMHPEYLATKYALETGSARGLELIAVQHHHAHIASCLVDNGVEGPAIGVSLDGTGYGTDGAIWGGEFLIADLTDFRRAGHLQYVPLLGGEAAIRKPYRMALSYIYTLLGTDFDLDGLPLAKLPADELALLRQQLERGVNCPPTSSAGRLFDAVSALTGVRGEINYEAQAAIELEMLADARGEGFEGESYPFSIAERDGVRVAELEELLRAIVRDIKGRVPTPIISLKFHRAVAGIALEMCRHLSKESGIAQVALSGGAFQNRLLLRLTIEALQREGLTVLTHRQAPANDGGVSLGQAVVANFALSG